MSRKVDLNLNLGIGNVSSTLSLGRYYQDISEAIVHIENTGFGKLDNNNIPKFNDRYSPILIIQYSLICLEHIYLEKNISKYKAHLKSNLNWLENNAHKFKESLVWRESYCEKYKIKEGWISGMTQGQALSLFLRAHQYFKNNNYLTISHKVFNAFQYDINDGGFKRNEKGYIWFEEYTTNYPSYVLNGYCYSILGLYDYYRVTKKKEAKELWEDSLTSLEHYFPKFDVWYWSYYDLNKKELVSRYYQKNVHIPLAKIFFQLTKNPIYSYYAKKWEKNLNNNINLALVFIMYRLKPRLEKLNKINDKIIDKIKSYFI